MKLTLLLAIISASLVSAPALAQGKPNPQDRPEVASKQDRKAQREEARARARDEREAAEDRFDDDDARDRAEDERERAEELAERRREEAEDIAERNREAAEDYEDDARDRADMAGGRDRENRVDGRENAMSRGNEKAAEMRARRDERKAIKDEYKMDAKGDRMRDRDADGLDGEAGEVLGEEETIDSQPAKGKKPWWKFWEG